MVAGGPAKLLVACSGGAYGVTGAVTDSCGNTWTAQQIGGAGQGYAYYAPVTGTGCAGGLGVSTAQTFTLTNGSSSASSLEVAGFTQVPTNSPLDVTVSGGYVFANSYTVPNLTPGQSGELVVSCVNGGLGGAFWPFSVGTPFTLQDQVDYVSGTSYGSALAWYVDPTTSATAPTWTPGDSGNPLIAAMQWAFKLAPAGSLTISPTTIPANHSGNIVLTLTGTGTSWVNGTTVFTPSGVTGVTKVSQNVTSGTAATLVVTTGSATGTLTVTESVTGIAFGTAAVTAATLSISPTSGMTGTTPTLTLTGANTLWTSEAAGGLFSVSGGSGASIGTPTVTSNTAATATLTDGSATGTLTITDSSTTATASFIATTPPTISNVSIVANSPWSVYATWITNVAADSTVSCGASSPWNTYTSNVVNPYATTGDGSTWGVTSHAMASNPMPAGASGSSCIVTSCNAAGCASSSAQGPITLASVPASNPVAMLNTKLVRTKLGDRYAGINGAPQTGAWAATDTAYPCWAPDGNTYWSNYGFGINGSPSLPQFDGQGFGTQNFVKFTDTAMTSGTMLGTLWQNGINNLPFNSYSHYWVPESCISVNGVLYFTMYDVQTPAHGTKLMKSADYLASSLTPEHNAGPNTTYITNMTCSGGTVTATSALNITDITTTGTNGIMQSPGALAIVVEGANGSSFPNVNGVFGVTAATSTPTISWSIGSSCTGWLWSSTGGTGSGGGTITVYAWDIPTSASSFSTNLITPIQTDASDYQNGTKHGGSDGFVYFWGIGGGHITLNRMRIEDWPLQDLTRSQCFSGPQTDAAGLLNSNWGGTCTAMNPIQFFLEGMGRGGNTPSTLYLTAQNRYVTAYQFPGGPGVTPDSISSGVPIFDNGQFPWSPIVQIGFLPRTPDPYVWTGPEFPSWIAASQASSNGVTTVNLEDVGGNFGINYGNPTANGYDMYVTRGVSFGPKSSASTAAPSLIPGEITNGLDLAYNFDMPSVGARAVMNLAPSDAQQKWGWTPSSIAAEGLMNPLVIDQYGLWMFSEASTSSAGGAFPSSDIIGTQSFTTPYTQALAGGLTLIDCFGHYPAALVGSPGSNAIVLQKSTDIQITWAGSNLWNVLFNNTALGSVVIPDNGLGCIVVRRNSQNEVTVYTSAGIGSDLTQLTVAQTSAVAAMATTWSSTALEIGDSSKSFWGIQSLLRVWHRDLADQELVAEMNAIRPALWAKGPGAAIPLYTPPSTAVTLVNHGTASGNASSIATSGIDMVTTGPATLLVACSSQDYGIAGAMSDSCGNTWAASQNALGYGYAYYAPVAGTSCGGAGVGTSQTFTLTNSSGSMSSLEVAGFANVTAGSPLDTGAGGSGGIQTAWHTGSTIQPGSLTPSGPNELVITCTSSNAGGFDWPVTVSTGFTPTDQVQYSSGNAYGSALAYMVQSTATPVNPTWTYQSGIGNIGALQWVFKSTSGGSIANLSVSSVTATQAVLTYTAPSSDACTVQVSQSNTLSPLVHDVDPTLFSGSNLDSRTGSVTSGTMRTFVIGQRAGQQGSDGNWYSRALQAYTQHYYQITCGSATVSGNFTTGNILLGQTFNEDLPPAPNAASASYWVAGGQYAWPQFVSWNNTTGRSEGVVDPQTGMLLQRVTMPQDFPSGGGDLAFTNVVAGSNWSNPSYVLVNDSNAASYTGSTSDWLFIGDATLSAGAGQPVDAMDFSVLGWCGGSAGTCTTGSNANIQVCPSVNGGVSCWPTSANVISVALGTTALPSSFSVAGSLAPLMATLTPAGYPPLTMADMAAVSGTVNVDSSGNVTWQGGSYFYPNWTAGSQITIAGSLCTISSTTVTATALAITPPSCSPAITLPATGASYSGGNFGFMVRKQTSSLDTIYLQYAKATWARSVTADWPSSGPPQVCSDTATLNAVTGDYGYHCLVAPSMYWIDRTTGVSTFLGYFSFPGQSGTNGWSGGFCNNNSLTLIGTGPTNPETFYCTASDNSGVEIIVSCSMTSTNQTGNLSISCTNLTPSSTSTDIVSLLQNFTASQSPAFSKTVFANGCGVISIQSGNLLLQCNEGDQDTIAWIAVFNPTMVSTSAGCVGAIASGQAGCVIAAQTTWAVAPARWCALHAASFTGTSSNVAWIAGKFWDNTGAPGGGPYYSTVTSGTLTSTPSIAAGIGGCPAGSAGCDILTVDGEPCNPSPVSPDQLGCPRNSSLGYLQAAAAGDLFSAGQGHNELMALISKSGSNWLFQRAYPSAGYVTTPQAYSGTLILNTVCGATAPYGNSTWTWDYMTDPYGLNSGGTTINAEYYYDHVTPRPTFVIGDDAAGSHSLAPFNQAYAVLNGSGFGAPNVFESYSPSFAGTQGVTEYTEAAQPHVSASQDNAPSTWFMDQRPASSVGPGLAGTASLVSGQLYKFTTTTTDGDNLGDIGGASGIATGINRKLQATMAFCGTQPLADISSPATGNAIGTTGANAYQYCIARNAGECRTGSSRGDIYMNCPDATPVSGSPGSFVYGCSYRGTDMCVFNTGAYLNAIGQIGYQSQDQPGLLARTLTKGLLRQRLNDPNANVRTLPDASWLLLESGPPPNQGYGAPYEILAGKVPPYPTPDSYERNTFIPITVNLTAPAGLGVTNAIVEFGYVENGSATQFFCTTRQDVCTAASAAIGAVPFYFASEGTGGVESGLTGLPCAGGCSLSIPGLPQRVLYYQVKYRDANNQVLAQTGVQVTVTP